MIIESQKPDQLKDASTYCSDHVECKENKEQEEVLVIPVAYAIVDEGTMVVKALCALVALVAMHRVLWSQDFAINADVVKMEFFIYNSFNKAQKVVFLRYVSRVDECDAVKDY